MGRRRSDFWPKFSVFMSQWRWDQIHLYLTFHIDTVKDIRGDNSSANDASAHWRLEPMWSTIRNNCRSAVTPATWLSIDEIMSPFHGRSNHRVKLKNKPIKEEYKIWAIGYGGYVLDWLSYSPVHGSENCHCKGNRLFRIIGQKSSIPLADTFQVLVRLCEELKVKHQHTKCVVFLDSLFLNEFVAKCLLSLEIGVIGTTRKNA